MLPTTFRIIPEGIYSLQVYVHYAKKIENIKGVIRIVYRSITAIMESMVTIVLLRELYAVYNSIKY
jgi:hypothetical protein